MLLGSHHQTSFDLCYVLKATRNTKRGTISVRIETSANSDEETRLRSEHQGPENVSSLGKWSHLAPWVWTTSSSRGTFVPYTLCYISAILKQPPVSETKD
ncbi:hypothetical protein CONPUDRAFT_85961 [Coniophora puteana RWD-64-598 SS2]|uniref:Uncharacterized protein n=1 Tax=Coniophora puteana (strain RWD-64-598) TaxID=741705 RepID=R7SEG7_CONPW|nr:uncharacterized protein CONPUDRAFT_85961 [Coniophora puteana RWD-64-598 SS2]EIW74230.1 hypothetical protein CONPUDRAFT_85961 [Coniophora puteana RWD-64-598 SS2]